MIQEGQPFPLDGAFQFLKDGESADMSFRDLFAGKRVILTAAAGAFHPVCHEYHIPGYVQKFDDFKKWGIDTVGVYSVNDVYTMDAWKKQLDPENKLLFLADGGAQNSMMLGTAMDTGNFGGTRSRMLAVYVEDGIVKKFLLEQGGAMEWSGDVSAENLLSQLPAKKARS